MEFILPYRRLDIQWQISIEHFAQTNVVMQSDPLNARRKDFEKTLSHDNNIMYSKYYMLKFNILCVQILSKIKITYRVLYFKGRINI